MDSDDGPSARKLRRRNEHGDVAQNMGGRSAIEDTNSDIVVLG